MDVFGPLFRLRPDTAGRPLAANHWTKRDDGWLVHHAPTHCIFAIDLPPGLAASDLIGPLHFRARLVHVCDGHAVPPHWQQAALARDGLLFFCAVTGLLPATDDGCDAAPL